MLFLNDLHSLIVTRDMPVVRNSLSLWKALTPKEKREAEFWLGMHSTGADSQALRALKAVKELKEVSPEEADAAIAKAFGIDKSNDDYLRTIHSRLATKLKAFLSQKGAAKKGHRDAYLLEELNARDLHTLISKEYKKAIKDLEAKPARTAEYYEKRYRLESEWQRHLVTHKPKGGKIPFSSANKSFDLWWMHGKLSHACISLSHQKIREEEYADPLLQEVLRLVETKAEFQEQPVLQFYLHFYKYLQGESRILPQAIIDQIQTFLPLFESDEQHNICTLMVSQMLGLLQGRSRDLKPLDLIKFYGWAIDQKAILKGAYLSWDHYRNLISLCLKYHYPAYAEKYLKNYKKLLPEKDRSYYYDFCRGSVLFYQKAYKKVRRCLNQKFPHPLLDHLASLTYLQASYKEGFLDKEELQQSLEKLAEKMKKEKKATFRRIAPYYLNKARFFKAMLNCDSKKKVQQVLKELGACEKVADKDWLIKEIGALRPL